MSDPEIEAIGTASAALADLTPEAQQRVVDWLVDRYRLAHTAATRLRDTSRQRQADPDGGDEEGEGGPATSDDYEHFADLFDAVNPTSDVDRALTGAYWFQVAQGQSSFQAQQVNSALKDVGHGLENIARALSNLQGRTPALVRQLSKSGRTKQARKTYKLTTAGVRAIEERLNG